MSAKKIWEEIEELRDKIENDLYLWTKMCMNDFCWKDEFKKIIPKVKALEEGETDEKD